MELQSDKRRQAK